MGNQTSKPAGELNFKVKTVEDLPKRERKIVKDLLKTNPHVMTIPSATPTSKLSPRHWVASKWGGFFTEPYLSDLASWSDGKYPIDGSFKKTDMDLVRAYLVDKTLIPNPTWTMQYMLECFQLWESVGPQYPGNKMVQTNTKCTKKLSSQSKPTLLMSQKLEEQDTKGKVQNKLYPSLDGVDSSISPPPAYSDHEEDDIDMWLACFNSKKDLWGKQISERLKVKPAVIFAHCTSDDVKMKGFRRDCVKAWFEEGTRAVKGITRRREGDQDRLKKELLSYVDELLRAEFRRIFKIQRNKEDVETNLASICNYIVGVFGRCVHIVQRQIGQNIDLTKPIEQNIKEKIFNSIPEDAVKEVLGLLIQDSDADSDNEALKVIDTPKVTQATKLNAPLLIFDDKVLDKALSLGEISKITKDAPDPLSKPVAFMNWYTILLMHGSLSGKDIRYVLTTLMPHITSESLIKDCPSLSEDNDMLEDEIIPEKKYPWLSKAHKDTHIQEMKTFLDKNASQEKDVSQILNCKRKPTENMSTFAERFLKAWKDDAKLEIKQEENAFFVSMFLQALDAQTAYTVKLACPGVFSYTPAELLKKIRELEAINLFKTPKIITTNFNAPLPPPPMPPPLPFSAAPRPPMGPPQRGPRRAFGQNTRFRNFVDSRRGRGRGRVGLQRGREIKSDDICYRCGGRGHWQRSCQNTPIAGNDILYNNRQPQPGYMQQIFTPQQQVVQANAIQAGGEQPVQISPQGALNPLWTP